MEKWYDMRTQDVDVTTSIQVALHNSQVRLLAYHYPTPNHQTASKKSIPFLQAAIPIKLGSCLWMIQKSCLVWPSCDLITAIIRRRIELTCCWMSALGKASNSWVKAVCRSSVLIRWFFLTRWPNSSLADQEIRQATEKRQRHFVTETVV